MSPPAAYRVLVEDIVSGHIATTSLDISSLRYADHLNRPGQVRATVAMGSPDATEALLREGQVALYVERNGRIEVGGPLWDITPDGDTIELVADGWLGYFDRRTIEVDRQFTALAAVDQFEIVETLVDDAQDVGEFGAGYDLGISVAWDALSGVTRERLEDYRPWRMKNLGEALRQLAACLDGFDMAMAYELDSDRITKTLRLFHPTKGRDAGHLLEYEHGKTRNVAGYSWPRSARAMAWAGTAWGDGADEARLSSARYSDETKRGTYPPLTAAPTFSGVTEQATLDDHAGGYFSRTSNPRRVPVLTLDPTAPPLWSDFTIGDTLRVRIDDRYAQVDGAFRFVGYEMAAETDTPKLTMELPADA